MKNNKLEHSKIKLTRIFTGIIFGTAFFIGFVFITGKYVHDSNLEKSGFYNMYSVIDNKVNFNTVNTLIASFEQKPIKTDNRRAIMRERLSSLFDGNIIILKNNELIYYKLSERVDEDTIEDILTNKSLDFYSNDGVYSKRIIKLDYDIFIFKQIRYQYGNYLVDIGILFLVILLFSLGFYYIGLKFVSKALKPVEENLKDMQDFIHNAGHELKTPISIISSNLQLIKQTKSFELDLVKEGLTEVNRLNHLIESLVELSNINSVNNNDSIDVNHDIKLAIKDFKVEAERKKIDINFVDDYKKILTINTQHFYILFSNILGNAIKYTNKGGKIDISITKKELVINDNGIGIKKENLDKIWDRFYTCSNSRQGDSHGIGLSLVKKIADSYNLKLEVKSKEGEGTKFIIKF